MVLPFYRCNIFESHQNRFLILLPVHHRVAGFLGELFLWRIRFNLETQLMYSGDHEAPVFPFNESAYGGD
jgi:hypothetical protein